MGARVAAANHLGELLTRTTTRPAPPQAEYQHLIDFTASFHRELVQRGMEQVADRSIAEEPELTDFQQEFLAAKQELLAMRARAATGAPLEPAG
jgi:hypothetical protein